MDAFGVAWQAVHIAQNMKTVRASLSIVLPTISTRRLVCETAVAISTIRITAATGHAVRLGVFKDNTL